MIWLEDITTLRRFIQSVTFKATGTQWEDQANVMNQLVKTWINDISDDDLRALLHKATTDNPQTGSV